MGAADLGGPDGGTGPASDRDEPLPVCATTPRLQSWDRKGRSYKKNQSFSATTGWFSRNVSPAWGSSPSAAQTPRPATLPPKRTCPLSNFHLLAQPGDGAGMMRLLAARLPKISLTIHGSRLAAKPCLFIGHQCGRT